MASFSYRTVDLSNGELEIERVSLLELIEATSPGRSEAAARKILKGEYNRVIEAQITHRRSVFIDPIDILPPEIWIRMIQHVVASSDGKSVEDLLMMTLVCTKWRDAILICPELWAEIELGPGLGQPDLMARLQTCLYLSGTYPLALFIEHPTRDWDLMVSVLRPHAERIGAIYIQPLSSKYAGKVDAEDPSISQLLASFGKLPRLHTLELGTQGINLDPLETFLRGTPSIYRINRQWIPLDDIAHVNLDSIRHIPIREDLTALFPWISEHPSLESLDQISSGRGGLGIRESNIPTHAIPSTAIRCLRLYSRAEDCLINLLIASRSLTQLSLKVSWRIMAEFIGVMDFLTLLDELTVEILFEDGRNNAFEPHMTPFRSHLRTLHVKHGIWPRQQEMLTMMRSSTTQLYRILESCVSEIQILTITAWEDFEIPFDYLSSLSRLYSLHLHLLGLETISDFQLDLASVRLLDLQLQSKPTLQFLSNLRCSNVLTLCIEQMDGGSQPRMSALELDPKLYPSLGTLEWGHSTLFWNPTSMDQLHTILFYSTHPTTPSDFCVYLAKRPYDCPRLERIDFREYPEWDCLFIMLERRNFLRDPSVRRIREVTFPSTVAPSIRQPLSDLLRGRFTQRPTNQDISLAGLGDVYWDRAIPGCHHCCMSMQPCHSPTIATPFLFYKHESSSPTVGWNEYVAAISSEPPLPAGVETWLSGRQDRHIKWHALKKQCGDIERQKACDNHELGWKYTTSGFTFCDLGADYSEPFDPYGSLHDKYIDESW